MVTPFQYAIKLLSMRDYPSKVLVDKLIKKEYSKEEASEAVAKCVDLGYINDEAFAESFIRLQKRKGKGAVVIRQLLKQKGLSAEVPSDDEYDMIARLLETKYRAKDLSDYPTRLKVMQSLVRRGFNLATIRDALTTSDI